MKESKEFSDTDGEKLVKMARKAVTEFLRNNSKIKNGKSFNLKCTKSCSY